MSWRPVYFDDSSHLITPDIITIIHCLRYNDRFYLHFESKLLTSFIYVHT